MADCREEGVFKGCLPRRGFLALASSAPLLAAGDGNRSACASGETPLVRFGFVADLHYADIEPRAGAPGEPGRHYREALAKLREAVAVFNARKVDFAVELGDFKDDTNGRDGTLSALERIEAEFAVFGGPRYHVPGNHDFDCITPGEFFARTPNGGKTATRGWYSFVAGGVTFIVLDGCHTSDGRHYCRSNPWTDSNIPPEEAAWLESELSAAKGHAVVFCHQRLDYAAGGSHRVKNAAEIRRILEESGKVRAVVSGHQHSGGYCRWRGIHYYTLAAMVNGHGCECNCYAEGAVYPSGAFTVTGFRNAPSIVHNPIPEGCIRS